LKGRAFRRAATHEKNNSDFSRRKEKQMTDQPQPLSHHVAKRLLAYATVAGAVTACSSHAAAEVIYTPVHSKVNFVFPVDLNHDGITDFSISSYYFSGLGFLSVKPTFSGNRIVSAKQVCGNRSGAAAALPVGARIGPGLPFQSFADCMAYGVFGSDNGSWVFVKGRYLGFAFIIDGKEHFGWARLNMNYFAYDELAEVLGFAYETIPNKPIIAGDRGSQANASAQPATLGALAAGAPALNSWRKEETKP
jgi:hypothetical protein